MKHTILLLLSILATCLPSWAQQPVKIFVLAGQSNMLGHGEMLPVTTQGTLEYIVANDPTNAYQFLKNPNGTWVVRNDVFIRDQDPKNGGLTVGYGAANTLIGPELGIGHKLGNLNENPILLVKAAWGGRSLRTEFRPPSSGGTTGFYYNEIKRLVNEATSNLAAYVPGYAGQGYQIAGFLWHQGFNDRVDPVASAEYEVNMANFIRDIRSSTHGLNVPNMPFVIATTGMDGDVYTQVEQAQLAMANATLYPDFVGNVSVIDTRSTYRGLTFWEPPDRSPSASGQGFHWNRNAKTYLHIGLAMADAMSILAPGRCPFDATAVGAPLSGVTVNWRNGTEIPTSVRILRNGVEVAAAAPGAPGSFLDSAALPGNHNYELIFTMPGSPCPPLTTTFNGGVTNLKASPGASNVVLTWTNNMNYSGIQVRRNGNLLITLAGNITTFTDTAPPSLGTATYTVVPTTGTSTPASDEINFSLRCQLRAINPFIANGGINPATGTRWKLGDTYRLAFLASTTTPATSTNINTYNAFVQGVAANSTAFPQLGTGMWKVVGSTAAVNARDNTDTNPASGPGVPIFRLDNALIATSNSDLWNESIANPLNITENNQTIVGASVFSGNDGQGTTTNPLGHPSSVQIGNSSLTDRGWAFIFGQSPSSPGYVYAMSEVLEMVNEGPDTTAPTVISLNPADNTTGVLVGSNLIARFSENISAVPGTTITIKNLSDSMQQVITLPDPQVTVSGKFLTIDPSSDFSPNKNYAIQIASTAIRDAAGNLFAGISNDTTWNFAISPPLVAEPGLWYGTVSGDINTTDENPKTSVTINLSEIQNSIADNTTEIYTGQIFDADGQISFTEHIDDKTRLFIDGILVLSSDEWSDRVSTANLNLSPGWHNFELRISNGGGGNGPVSSPGFGYDPNGGTNWIIPSDPGNGSLFRHLTPVIQPEIISLLPVNNGTASIVTDLTATFNTNIAIGTGSITIKKLTPPTSQTVIAVTDSSQITVSGKVLIINPTANLAVNSNYSVQISNTAIRNTSGDAFAGISNDTTWNFTTTAQVPGVLGTPQIITSNATSGISSSNTYTHAFNMGGGNVTINGVTFLSGNASGTNYSTTNFSNSISGNFTEFPNQGDSVASMLNPFRFGFVGQSLTITGLTPGQRYDARIYTREWGSGDNRSTLITFDEDGTGPNSSSITVNADAAPNAFYLSYVFVATNQPLVISFAGTAGNTGASFHLSGFSVQTAPLPGFGSWANANGAAGQAPQQDHDNDSVSNGIEFFMGATGSSFTANPGLNSSNVISWPASAAYQGTYEVQTSPDLVNWTNVTPKPSVVGGFLSYSLPAGAPGGKNFVRLLVTPSP